jgi:hypothetical protein
VFFRSEEKNFILKTSYAIFSGSIFSGSADNIVGQLGLKNWAIVGSLLQGKTFLTFSL